MRLIEKIRKKAKMSQDKNIEKQYKDTISNIKRHANKGEHSCLLIDSYLDTKQRLIKDGFEIKTIKGSDGGVCKIKW